MALVVESDWIGLVADEFVLQLFEVKVYTIPFLLQLYDLILPLPTASDKDMGGR